MHTVKLYILFTLLNFCHNENFHIAAFSIATLPARAIPGKPDQSTLRECYSHPCQNPRSFGVYEPRSPTLGNHRNAQFFFGGTQSEQPRLQCIHHRPRVPVF